MIIGVTAWPEIPWDASGPLAVGDLGFDYGISSFVQPWGHLLLQHPGCFSALRANKGPRLLRTYVLLSLAFYDSLLFFIFLVIFENGTSCVS